MISETYTRRVDKVTVSFGAILAAKNLPDICLNNARPVTWVLGGGSCDPTFPNHGKSTAGATGSPAAGVGRRLRPAEGTLGASTGTAGGTPRPTTASGSGGAVTGSKDLLSKLLPRLVVEQFGRSGHFQTSGCVADYLEQLSGTPEGGE